MLHCYTLISAFDWNLVQNIQSLILSELVFLDLSVAGHYCWPLLQHLPFVFPAEPGTEQQNQTQLSAHDDVLK